MDMKSTFRRWKNGWRSKSSQSKPTVARVVSEADAWCETTRQAFDALAGSQWNPFTKWVWLRQLSFNNAEDRREIFERLRDPMGNAGVGYSRPSEIEVLTDVMVDGQPTDADSSAALTFFVALMESFDDPYWQDLAELWYPTYNFTASQVVIYYLQSHFGLAQASLSDRHIRFLLWDLAGRPKAPNHSYLDMPHCGVKKLTRQYYNDAFRRLWFSISQWRLIGARCCDFPNELEPGVNSLYKHTCRFKPYEETTMAKDKTVKIIHRRVGYNHNRWFAITDRGEFPVVAGGEPGNLDVLCQPFYRFEPGPEHGLTTCVIRLSAGAPGHYWYIRITKAMEIHSITDQNKDHVECITLPLDHPGLALFRIDCPLKSVL